MSMPRNTKEVEAPGSNDGNEDGSFSMNEIVSALPAEEESTLATWAAVSPDEWDTMENWAQEEEATMLMASVIDDDETKFERRRVKARKWLMNWITDYESEKKERLEEHGVQVQRIYHSVAYALWYLNQGRQDFGETGLDWIEGLCIELRMLSGIDDDTVTLEVIQSCLIVVFKMHEQNLGEQIRDLFYECRFLAVRMYEKYYSPGVKLHMGIRNRSDLFTIMNNIACLDLDVGSTSGGKEMIRNAANLVSDTDAEADIFLLNSGSLLVADNDIPTAEQLLKRAVSLAESKLEKLHAGEAEIAAQIAECKAELEVAKDEVIQEIPAIGKEFIVRTEGDKVTKLSARVPELQAQLQRLHMEAFERKGNEEALRLRCMRSYRKLGNMYGRLFTTPRHRKLAEQLADKLLKMEKLCAKVPIKDVLGNTSFVLDSLFQRAANESRFKQRRACFAVAMDLSQKCIVRVEEEYGEEHTIKKSAEVYEKAAIASMLTQQEPEYATRLAQQAFNIRVQHQIDADMWTARALLCLSESWAYAGEFDRAMDMAVDAHAIAKELLGPRHLKVKQLSKTWVEHKKILMKCSSAGMGKIQMRTTARRMIMAKMEQKGWIREWAC